MPGPGEYLPDVSEGITCVEDLPKPKVVSRSRNFPQRPCPCCGHRAYRRRQGKRILHDLGDLASGRPCDIHLSYSVHRCSKCRRNFNADMLDLALPGSHYTHRVIGLSVRLVVEDGLPYRAACLRACGSTHRQASWHLWRDHRVFVPFATIQNWVEAAGEKRRSSHRRRLP